MIKPAIVSTINVRHDRTNKMMMMITNQQVSKTTTTTGSNNKIRKQTTPFSTETDTDIIVKRMTMTNDGYERGQHHQQLLPMIVALEVDECVFVVDVVDIGNKEVVATTNNNDDGDGKDGVDIVDDSIQIKFRSTPDATNDKILFPPFLFSISHTPVVQQKEEDGNDHQQQQG